MRACPGATREPSAAAAFGFVSLPAWRVAWRLIIARCRTGAHWRRDAAIIVGEGGGPAHGGRRHWLYGSCSAWPGEHLLSRQLAARHVHPEPRAPQHPLVPEDARQGLGGPVKSSRGALPGATTRRASAAPSAAQRAGQAPCASASGGRWSTARAGTCSSLVIHHLLPLSDVVETELVPPSIRDHDDDPHHRVGVHALLHSRARR